MKRQMQRNAVVVLGSLSLMAAILLVPKVAALPGAGMGSAFARPDGPPPRTTDPAILVEQGFEKFLGRDLDRREEAQLKIAIREFQQFQAEQERPQKASYATHFFSTNEFLPVFCLYGKVSGKVPKIGGLSLGGVGGATERTICVLTNSLYPWAWKPSEFHSYVMKGISGTSAGSPWGGVSVGLSGGIYIGPKNTTRQFVGKYKFGRLMLEKGLANVNIQAAYNDNEQYVVMVGAAGELSWEAILRAVRVLPKLDPSKQTASVAGLKWEGGLYYEVKEFPWFNRLLNGWDPISAFSDVEQYIAANN